MPAVVGDFKEIKMLSERHYLNSSPLTSFSTMHSAIQDETWPRPQADADETRNTKVQVLIRTPSISQAKNNRSAAVGLEQSSSDRPLGGAGVDNK